MKKLVLSIFCVGFAVAASAQTSTNTPPKKAHVKKLNKPLVVKKSVVTVSPTAPAKTEQSSKKQPVTRQESAVIEEKKEKK